jgi:hypothetical protein
VVQVEGAHYTVGALVQANYGERALFRVDGVPVGRITAQVDSLHLERYKDATGHFGFIEATDDREVFAALLQTAEAWLKAQGMERCVGPVSFSMWDEPGLLVEGFPRERVQGAEIAGVRTNFKMPDVLSVGLGGGSIVNSAGDELSIGPVSVGFRLKQEARIFGGDTLTATDIAVAHGLLVLGNPATLGNLSPALVDRAVDRMQDMLSAGIERMKPGKQDIPVILTGGGSVLVKGELIGNCRVIRPPHYASANAVGAAIAQISGEVDRIFSVERDQRAAALEAAKTEARQKAVAAGAKPDTVDIVEVDETPLAYLPNNATRIRVKAIGDLLA